MEPSGTVGASITFRAVDLNLDAGKYTLTLTVLGKTATCDFTVSW
jgi:hypothetical protein